MKTLLLLLLLAASAISQTVTFNGSGRIETPEYTVSYIAPVTVYLPSGQERIGWLTIQTSHPMNFNVSLTYYTESGASSVAQEVSTDEGGNTTIAFPIPNDAMDITLTIDLPTHKFMRLHRP